MERFTFKSWRPIRLRSLIKEDWHSKNFGSKQLYTTLRWLRIVHVWLLVRFSVFPLIYCCACNTCGKLVKGHDKLVKGRGKLFKGRGRVVKGMQIDLYT